MSSFTVIEHTPVDIEDIARSLSNICRFAGRVRKFYSVAEHSIEVASRLPDDIAIYGLLHDVAEVYIGDIPTHVKNHIQVRTGRKEYMGMCDYEQTILGRILTNLGLCLFNSTAKKVHHVDKRMLSSEFRRVYDGEYRHVDKEHPPYPLFIPHFYKPDDARNMFLTAYYALTDRI